MRETYLAVAGVVATDPTVRTLDDGRQVMSFRVASTSRRYDTTSKTWADGTTLWVKVSCWRELADNASKCVRKRDRILVWGRVKSEQWKGEGGMRSDLALDAEAMGHDLTFGVSVFDRKKRTVAERTLTDVPIFDPVTGEIVGVPAVPPAAVAAGAPDPVRDEPDDELDDDEFEGGELDDDDGDDDDDGGDDDDDGFEERGQRAADAAVRGGAGAGGLPADARKEELIRSA
jgi:single-strand DNA-binding protein